MRDIPKKYRDLLAKVQSVIPGAVLAGGALRDNVLGLRPNDIDIFIPWGREFAVA